MNILISRIFLTLLFSFMGLFGWSQGDINSVYNGAFYAYIQEITAPEEFDEERGGFGLTQITINHFSTDSLVFSTYPLSGSFGIRAIVAFVPEYLIKYQGRAVLVSRATNVDKKVEEVLDLRPLSLKELNPLYFDLMTYEKENDLPISTITPFCQKIKITANSIEKKYIECNADYRKSGHGTINYEEARKCYMYHFYTGDTLISH